MSKNNELIINNFDQNKSFSIKSDNSEKSDLEYETEIETKTRQSLEKALSSNNNAYAFEKINKNINLFCSNIQILQDYSLCLGSKLDNKEKGDEIDKIILKTGDEIVEIFNLIEIIKNFAYKDRNQKIQNITKANRLEDECNKYKKKFDDLTDKIKQQNLNLIKQARASVRYSNYSDFSGEIHLNNDEPKHTTEFQNGKEFLDGIEMKRKQNDAIYKAAKKIEKSLSRRNTMIFNIQNFNEINNNQNMDVFNIEYKKTNDFRNHLLSYDKRNTIDENKYTSMRNSNDDSRRMSKAFHEMEDKVYIALEGVRQNFIRRHWFMFLIILLLIVVLVYYIFFMQKKI